MDSQSRRVASGSHRIPAALRVTAPSTSTSTDTSQFWSVASTLLAGLVVWGGIGFGVDHLLGTKIFVPAGLLLGHLGSLYLVYLKVFRTGGERDAA